MGKYVLKRILLMIPVVIGVAVLIFTIMYLIPGDPAQSLLGADATALEIEAKRQQLGLNDSYVVQLGRFLYELFFRFNLGESYANRSSVAAEIAARFPRTLAFALGCMMIRTLVGIPLGVTAAVHQNGLADRICMAIALVGVSLPEFWVAMMLVIVFALKLNILPAYGIGGIQYYILPIIAGSLGGIAQQARQTRSSILEVIRSDYVTTARAKGLAEWKILYQHVLPNGLIPVIQVIGSGFGISLGGALIIEQVFSIPGMGMYLTSAVSARDYPVVRGTVICLAIAFSIVMLLVDLIFAFVDPRIKAQYENQSKIHRRKSHG